MDFTYDACVAQHQGDRLEQQDRAGLLQNTMQKTAILAVVADGMGGHKGGAEAASQVLFTAKSLFNQYDPRADQPEEFLRQALMEAHTLIGSLRFFSEKDPHSTAVLLLVQESGAFWAHCGDSRLYCFRNKACRFCTRDHSYVESLVAKKKITAEEALNHPQRNILLSSLGGEPQPTINFGKSTVPQIGDSYLLCSDGIWPYFNEAELSEIVSAQSARAACAQLIEMARQRSGETDQHGDNISIVIVNFVEKQT